MKIKIWAPFFIHTQALQLQRQLQILGFQAEWTSFVDPNSEDLHIIYCSQLLEAFPANYIVYQTEAGKTFFRDRYIRIMHGAIAVWDYDKLNTQYYFYQLPTWLKLSIVRPGIYSVPKVDKDIDVLFYGSMNEHRSEILNAIKTPVKKVFGTYGVEMQELLNRTKIVLNIRYYDQAALELFRITESLSHACHVISEPPLGEDRAKYGTCIHWASSAYEFEMQIKNVVNKAFDYDLAVFNNTEDIRLAMQQLSSLIGL